MKGCLFRSLNLFSDYSKKLICFTLSVLLLTSSFACIANADWDDEDAVATLDEYKGYTADSIMNCIYSANNLYSIFETHGRMRAEVKCYREDHSVAYSKIVEATHTGSDTHVRIRHESDYINGEMEGSSEAGYIACRWEDGTTEAAVSYPDEFLPLIQETYLDPYGSVTFDNVAMSMQDGALIVSADMHYNNVKTAHTMYYYVDPEDFRLLAVFDEYSSEAGTSFNHYLFSYDQEAILDECTILDDVMYADDACNLSIVYVAPEYGFTQVKDYTISESVTPNLDSRGFFNLYTSPELTRDSEVDNIDIDGDTTIYAVITSYMLQDMESQAASESSLSESVSVSTPTPTPEVTPAPVVTPVPEVSPAPVVTPVPEVTPAPVVTPVPEVTPAPSSNIIVTKSPTPETVNVGGTAYFNATAQNFDSIVWSLINSDGSSILATDAANYFGGLRVYGNGSNTLTLENIPKSLNGWTARCAFINDSGAEYTDSALITVNDPAGTNSSSQNQPVVINKTSSDELKALAEKYSYDAVANVSDRVGSWGWNVYGVSDFSFDESQNTARFSINASYSNRNVTFYFNAYPVLQYYVPVGFDSVITASDGTVYPLISRNFYSTTDTASCWASFGDGLVAISSAPDIDQASSESNSHSLMGSSENNVVDIPEVTPYIPEPTGFTPGQSLGSGTFNSIQNDLLVLHVYWSAVAESSDTVNVTLNANLESRSIYTNSCPMSMSVGNQEISFYTGGFTYEDNDVHYTSLGSYSFKINATESCSLPVVVIWNFRGTYGEQYIDNLFCVGDAYISA